MNSRNVRAWTRYAIAAALVIVVLSPALWLVLMSLRPNTDIMATTLAFRPTLHNYGHHRCAMRYNERGNEVVFVKYLDREK